MAAPNILKAEAKQTYIGKVSTIIERVFQVLQPWQFTVDNSHRRNMKIKLLIKKSVFTLTLSLVIISLSLVAYKKPYIKQNWLAC